MLNRNQNRLLFIYLFICLFIYLFICLFINLFVYLFIYLFTYLLIYLFVLLKFAKHFPCKVITVKSLLLFVHF